MEYIQDPKEIGVPNICFSILSDGDNREEEYRQQRYVRGFDDSETWSLRDTIANFIIPRLECYQEIANDVLRRDETLVKDIDTFLQSMKLISRDGGTCIFTEEEWNIVKEGMENFSKIFMSLWW